MKRSDMILKLMEILVEAPEDVEAAADQILARLEKLGMRPPAVDSDKCQALMTVYYAGYTFNQWDEDFEADVAVMEAYKRRMERKCSKS